MVLLYLNPFLFFYIPNQITSSIVGELKPLNELPKLSMGCDYEYFHGLPLESFILLVYSDQYCVPDNMIGAEDMTSGVSTVPTLKESSLLWGRET